MRVSKRIRPGKRARVAVAAILAAVSVAGCGSASKRIPATPHPLGETYGQQYDEAKYEACIEKDRANSRCELFRLRRLENPDLWPYADVPPLKWPEPPTETVYREGMTPEEYWRALCKAEAGEFIYRTVEDADGLYQIRPREREPEFAWTDRYVMEDPYGYNLGEDDYEIFYHFLRPTSFWREGDTGYGFVESRPLSERAKRFAGSHPSLRSKPSAGDRFERYFGSTPRMSRPLRMEWASELKSRYGFIWRGIRRPHDRELGVAGGELAVVDLHTNEILGLRRGFLLGYTYQSGMVTWNTGNACPEYISDSGIGQSLQRNKSYGFGRWFVIKVAKPSGREYAP